MAKGRDTPGVLLWESVPLSSVIGSIGGPESCTALAPRAHEGLWAW